MEYSSQKDELLLELQECREDERNSRMEILGAFTAGETILGVLVMYLIKRRGDMI